MALYSKDGSYPKPQKDNTNGWVQVLDPPAEIPEGKELRWLNWEWIVRDPKPEDRPGFQWNWNHADKAWVECEYPQTAPVDDIPEMILEPTPVTTSAAASDEFGVTVNGAPV
jgi:hypothetical protein